MEIIHHNDAKTVGIVSDIANPQPIGVFTVAIIKEWLTMAEMVYGEQTELMLVVKRSEHPNCDGYLLGVSKDGEAPFVCCTGQFRADGKNWSEKQ